MRERDRWNHSLSLARWLLRRRTVWFRRYIEAAVAFHVVQYRVGSGVAAKTGHTPVNRLTNSERRRRGRAKAETSPNSVALWTLLIVGAHLASDHKLTRFPATWTDELARTGRPQEAEAIASAQVVFHGFEIRVGKEFFGFFSGTSSISI